MLTCTMLPQKDDSNAEATEARELPWNMNELLGDEAIDCSVDVDTVPKPIAKIEMPADLTLVAVVIAELEPPYDALCSPSLSSTITRGSPDELPCSMSLPLFSPAPMFV